MSNVTPLVAIRVRQRLSPIPDDSVRRKPHTEIQPERTALETVHCGEFMRPTKVKTHHLLDGSHPNLYAHRVHRIMHTRVADGATAVIGNLKRAVAGGAGFEEE